MSDVNSVECDAMSSAHVTCIFCRASVASEFARDHYYAEHALSRGLHDAARDYANNVCAPPPSREAFEQIAQQIRDYPLYGTGWTLDTRPEPA